MKSDVINWSQGIETGKMVSKETLNHPEFINKVSGCDVYKDTHRAFLRAYQALGIDIINRVPINNAPVATPEGQKKMHPDKPYSFTNLGVFDTAFREKFEVSSSEEVFQLGVKSLRYEDLILSVFILYIRGVDFIS